MKTQKYFTIIATVLLKLFGILDSILFLKNLHSNSLFRCPSNPGASNSLILVLQEETSSFNTRILMRFLFSFQIFCDGYISFYLGFISYKRIHFFEYKRQIKGNTYIFCTTIKAFIFLFLQIKGYLCISFYLVHILLPMKQDQKGF